MSTVSLPNNKIYTAEDVRRFDANGHRYELVEGELMPMSPTNARHGRETMNLAGQIWLFVDTNCLGQVYAAETGFRLSAHPDTVLAPDISYIRQERLAGISDDGYIVAVPDVVVETRSTGDSERKTVAKLRR